MKIIQQQQSIHFISHNAKESLTHSLQERKNLMTFAMRFAVRTRLELVTSCVTGRHSNQLN